jgi:hypothetical protein
MCPIPLEVFQMPKNTLKFPEAENWNISIIYVILFHWNILYSNLTNHTIRIDSCELLKVTRCSSFQSWVLGIMSNPFVKLTDTKEKYLYVTLWSSHLHHMIKTTSQLLRDFRGWDCLLQLCHWDIADLFLGVLLLQKLNIYHLSDLNDILQHMNGLTHKFKGVRQWSFQEVCCNT